MNLRILLPSQVFAQINGVLSVVAETAEGSFGLLPHRLDCVLALIPGILSYEAKGEGEVYIAVDHGVLIKAGADLLVSVRRAASGTDLALLRDSVERDYADLNEREQSVHAVMAKLEVGLLHRLVGLQHD